MKTIQDIAKMANVSKSTVSRYLNGGSVSKDTYEKLTHIIETTGYRPNKFAQSLKAKRTGLIGAIVPRLTSRSVTQTLSGLDTFLRDRSYQLLIVNADQSIEREIESLYAVAKQKVDGIVLFATTITDAHVSAINEIGIPVILLGQRHPSICSLVYDDYQAGYELANYISAQGYKRAVYLSVGADDESIGVLRRKGVEDGLLAGNVTYTVKETTFDMEAARECTNALLTEEVPEVVICATDDIAFGAMKAIRQHGLSIPEDIGVAGFGGSPLALAVSPGLTTIRFHYQKAGEGAGRVLIDILAEEKVSPQTFLTHELIIQESAIKKY